MARNEVDFYTLLSGAAPAAVGDRIYPDRAPQNVGRPYVVWMFVTQVPHNTLATDRASKSDRAIVDVDIYSETRLEAKSIARTIRAALETEMFCVAERDLTELESDLYRTQVEFSFHVEV